MSLVQRRLGHPPESSGSGVSAQQYQTPQGKELGCRCLACTPTLLGTRNWGSHTIRQKPTKSQSNALLACGLARLSGCGWLKCYRMGKGGLASASPTLTCTACSQVVPINYTASCWAFNQQEVSCVPLKHTVHCVGTSLGRRTRKIHTGHTSSNDFFKELWLAGGWCKGRSDGNKGSTWTSLWNLKWCFKEIRERWLNSEDLKTCVWPERAQQYWMEYGWIMSC